MIDFFFNTYVLLWLIVKMAFSTPKSKLLLYAQLICSFAPFFLLPFNSLVGNNARSISGLFSLYLSSLASHRPKFKKKGGCDDCIENINV